MDAAQIGIPQRAVTGRTSPQVDDVGVSGDQIDSEPVAIAGRPYVARDRAAESLYVPMPLRSMS